MSEDGTALTAESISTGATSRKSRDRLKTKRPKGKGKGKGRGRDRERSSSRHSEREKWTAENNPCKYCRKYKRVNRHPNIPKEECFFNKKYKGYPPHYACEKMGLKYFPPGAFMSDAESSSEEE